MEIDCSHSYQGEGKADNEFCRTYEKVMPTNSRLQPSLKRDRLDL